MKYLGIAALCLWMGCAEGDGGPAASRDTSVSDGAAGGSGGRGGDAGTAPDAGLAPCAIAVESYHICPIDPANPLAQCAMESGTLVCHFLGTNCTSAGGVFADNCEATIIVNSNTSDNEPAHTSIVTCTGHGKSGAELPCPSQDAGSD